MNPKRLSILVFFTTDKDNGEALNGKDAARRRSDAEAESVRLLVGGRRHVDQAAERSQRWPRLGRDKGARRVRIEGGKRRRDSARERHPLRLRLVPWRVPGAGRGRHRHEVRSVQGRSLPPRHGWRGLVQAGVDSFPSRISIASHLDPFFASCCVLSCFDRDAAHGVWRAVDVVGYGEAEDAAEAIEAMIDLRWCVLESAPTRSSPTFATVSALSLLRAPRSEPWIPRTSASTALERTARRAPYRLPVRVISRRSSKRDLPCLTRVRAVARRCACRSEDRVLASLEVGDTGKVVKPAGGG